MIDYRDSRTAWLQARANTYVMMQQKPLQSMKANQAEQKHNIFRDWHKMRVHHRMLKTTTVK